MEFIKNLPIGLYVPGDSFIHKLDPRTKLIFAFAFVLTLFFIEEVSSLLAFSAIAIIAIVLSGIQFAYLARSLRGFLIMVLIFGLLQAFFFDEGRILWQWSWIAITDIGINKAIFLVIRLVILIIITSLLTLTTSPVDLTDGIERLLKPLTRFHIPVHEIALMMTISMRYIPTLTEEMEKIMKAQTARGANFESRNILKRIQSLLPVLVPIFVSSFRRAEELALAMEARCYRAGMGRTKWRRIHFHWRDGVVAVVFLILFVYIGILEF